MFHRCIAVLLVMAGATCAADERAVTSPAAKPAPDRAALAQFIESHCLACHSKATQKAGLALDELLGADIERNSEAWEKVVRKLTARQMPPRSKPRPPQGDYNAAISVLET